HSGRAVILAYSLQREGVFDIVQSANAIFGIDRVRWHVLEQERILRINGIKQYPNPMPLDRIVTKAECRFDIEDSRRSEARSAYTWLYQSLTHMGYTHLAMGILDILL